MNTRTDLTTSLHSRPTRFVLWFFLTLLVVAYAAYCTSLSLCSLASFPPELVTNERMPFLSDKPIGEDGFYMLTVAWGIGEGKGIRYNGKPTTGIQPAATFAYGLVARIIQRCGWSKWAFLRLVILLGAMTLVLFAELVYRIARHLLKSAVLPARLRLVAYTLTLGNFGLFRTFTYGLETGLYLCLLGWVVLFTLQEAQRLDGAKAIQLGLLTGFTALARVDFLLVLTVYTAAALYKRTMKPWQVFLTAVTTSAIVAPWFLFVFRITGSWLPSSGGAQLSVLSTSSIGHRTWEMLKAVVDHLTPWAYTAQRNSLTLLAIASIVVAWVVIGRMRIDADVEAPPTFRCWGFAFAMLVLVYPALFWSTHFYYRYVSPISVFLLPWLAVWMLATASRKIRAVGLEAVCIVGFVAAATVSLHSGRVGNVHSIAAGFVRETFGPETRVGAFQSGVVGFFHENTINLDGKMNSDALKALLKDQTGRYIDSEDVKVLVDWKSVLESVLSSDYLDNWNDCNGVIRNAHSICLVRP